MSGFYPQGMTLKALLENPSLLNPTKQKKDSTISDENKLKDVDDNVLDFGSAFLGPTLWDSTLPYNGNDFKLEYMDLDEFLSENGIPINPASSPTMTLPTMPSSAPSSPVASPQHSSSTPFLSMTAAASPPKTPPSVCIPDSPSMSPGMHSVLHGPFHGLGGHSPGPGHSPGHSSSASLSPQPQLEKPACPQSPINLPTKEPETVSLEKESNTPQNSNESWAQSSDSRDTESETPKPKHAKSTEKRPRRDSLSDSMEQVATIPGQDGFDPQQHIFSSEELKPQPMIKKSRKVFVPEDLKDDKYWARRKKNNVAAKRSRDARRVKENQIAMRANFLEDQYSQMKMMLEATQKENQILKEKLAKYEKQ